MMNTKNWSHRWPAVWGAVLTMMGAVCVEADSSKPNVILILADDMNYGDKGEELHDMVKDPHQYTNVVDDPEYAEILRDARAKFRQRMAAAGQIAATAP